MKILANIYEERFEQITLQKFFPTCKILWDFPVQSCSDTKMHFFGVEVTFNFESSPRKTLLASFCSFFHHFSPSPHNQIGHITSHKNHFIGQGKNIFLHADFLAKNSLHIFVMNIAKGLLASQSRPATWLASAMYFFTGLWGWGDP